MKVAGSALFPALSVALNVIVFVLPRSSALVVIVIRSTFLLTSFISLVVDTCPAKILFKYFVRKSLASRLTFLSSVAVTVNDIC